MSMEPASGAKRRTLSVVLDNAGCGTGAGVGAQSATCCVHGGVVRTVNKSSRGDFVGH